MQQRKKKSHKNSPYDLCAIFQASWKTDQNFIIHYLLLIPHQRTQKIILSGSLNQWVELDYQISPIHKLVQLVYWK